MWANAACTQLTYDIPSATLPHAQQLQDRCCLALSFFLPGRTFL